MNCPKCSSQNYRISVQVELSCPAGFYGNLTKRNLRKKEVYLTAALWETTNFICNKCQYVDFGYGNYVSNMRKTLEWYAGNHRPEDYLDDNGERARKALNWKK